MAATLLKAAFYFILFPFHVHYTQSPVTTDRQRRESPTTIPAPSILLMKTMMKMLVNFLSYIAKKRCGQAKNMSVICVWEPLCTFQTHHGDKKIFKNFVEKNNLPRAKMLLANDLIIYGNQDYD